MTTSTRTRSTVLALAASTLIGAGSLALAPAAHAGSDEGQHRGYELGCQARLDGKPVRVSIHVDDFTINTVVVKVGSTEGYGQPAKVVTGRKVKATARVGGEAATVTGTLRKVGKAKHTRTSRTDEYGTYVTEGTRTKVRTDLAISYDGERAPLTCGTAYAFDTVTTKTDA